MSVLLLNSQDRANLSKILNGLEAKNGNEYIFKPKNENHYCTCQGNCDGKTGGCAWH